jgi:hypothetical protein
MFTIITLILSLIFLWFLIRLLLHRAYIYEYVTIAMRRRPVLVAYLKSDGTIIDITLPQGMRRVGQVYLKEGKGIVRLYRGDDEYEEVGYVDCDGNIFSADGTLVSKISPEGKRHWYELFLRRHADVPEGAPDPFGKCVETGRFRARKPNTATLLARAGAALVLYRMQAKGIGETPRLAPHKIWDTALLASIIFTIIYFIPGIVQLFDRYYTVFPIIGRKWSYIISVSGLYIVLWMLLHLWKVAWLSTSNEVLAYLTMINRQTGIQRWGSLGIVLSVLGILWGFFAAADTYLYVPLFFATFIGFVASRIFAIAEAWYVEPRYREYYEERGEEEEKQEEGDIVKDYAWHLDSPLRDVTLSTSAFYRRDEIDSIRKDNPFYQNWQDASANGRITSRKLVLTGEQARQVRQLAKYIIARSKQDRLTRFEEMQAALDFVQEGNIKYALDEDCEEINKIKDYYRFPAETMFDKRGDCDCKSILAAALIRNLGYPVLLLISFKAEHAAIAVGGAPDLEGIPGLFFINRGGQRYYFCETTGEGWTVGQESELARQMRDDLQSVVDLTSDLPSKI